MRLLLLLIAGAIAVAAVSAAANKRKPDGVLLTEDGQTVEVTAEARAATLRFAAAVPPADRAWVLAAIAAARPEAQALLGEVDGMTTVGALAAPDGITLGVAQGGPSGFSVDLDLVALGGVARGDRSTVVLPLARPRRRLRARRRRDAVGARRADPARRAVRARRRLRRSGGALRGHVRQVGAARRGLRGGGGLRHRDAGVDRDVGRTSRPPRAHPAEVGCGAVRNAEAERFIREVWAVFQRDGVPGVLEPPGPTRAGARTRRTGTASSRPRSIGPRSSA